jgi:hypothetical protein
VQVVDASQALENRNKSVYDPDEQEEEDKERKLRQTLNRAFKKFVEQVVCLPACYWTYFVCCWFHVACLSLVGFSVLLL